MKYKRNILFIISIIVVFLLYNEPFYNYWFYNRILVPDDHGDIFYQVQHLDKEERREFRFGDSYIFYRDLLNQFKEHNVQNITLLLPPNEYVHKMNFDALIIPEPAVFYYFTGVNAVTKSSPDVRSANWALVAANGKVWMNRLRTRPQLDSLLALYKPYKD